MTDLTSQFEAAMWNIYEEAKRPPCRYTAGYFRDMLAQYGGVETAKRLLATTEVQAGFTELYLCNRLDLTVECHVLQPQFQSLFSPAELDAARRRLGDLGFYVDDSGKLLPRKTAQGEGRRP